MQAGVAGVSHKPYKYKLLNGQKFIVLPNIFEKEKFHNLIIDFGVIALQVPSSPDYLTFCETNDVETSLAEIEAGKAKKFKSIDAFLIFLPPCKAQDNILWSGCLFGKFNRGHGVNQRETPDVDP